MSISSTPSRNRTSSVPDAAICRVFKRALARHEAEIERADARRRVVQHAIAVPAVLHGAEIDRGLGGQRRDRRAVGARKRPGADQHQRTLGLAQRVGKGVPRNVGERLRAGAEIIVSVSQVRLRPDDADREFAGAPALADARIEDRPPPCADWSRR